VYIKKNYDYGVPSVIILVLANTQNKYVSSKTTSLNAPSLDEPQIYVSGLWISSYTFFIL